MPRRALTASLVAFALLAMMLVAVLFLTMPLTAAASGPGVLQTPVATPQPAGGGAPAAANTGRPITRQDWIAHVPLFCAMTLLVIVVDALFIGKLLYDRRKNQAVARVSAPTARH